MPFRNDPDLQLILHTALDAVIVMRADGTVADWNSQAEVIFGRRRDEVVGREMSQLIIPPRYQEAHRAGLERYLETGAGRILHKRVEITALRSTGAEFPVELSISPILRGNERLFLGFVRDISARVESDKSRARRAREIEILYRVTSMGADASSLEEALTLCLSSICELLDWPIGHAFLPGPRDTSILVSSVWVGAIDTYPVLKHTTETTLFTRGQALPGFVWAKAEPHWIEEVKSSRIFPRGNEPDFEMETALGLPIISGAQVVAILEFFNTAPSKLDKELLLTAQSIGSQIGRVLERRAVLERQTLLMHELDHRAKNMLAVVMGIAHQTAKNAPSVDAFAKEFLGRLSSLSRTYSLLTAGNWDWTTLDALVNEVVAPHLSGARDELRTEGGELRFPPKKALGVSMLLHELATNAVKHGALSGGGRINVTASEYKKGENRMMILDWKESGLRNVSQPTRRGFGSKLIQNVVRYELGGEVDINYDTDGIRYRFEFPELKRGETPKDDLLGG